MYETDNYISSYVSMKLEKMGEQNFKISHIDREISDLVVYKQKPRSYKKLDSMCFEVLRNSRKAMMQRYEYLI